MRRFTLSAAAEADLAGIIDYTIRTWGADQAAAYLDALESRLRILAESPGMGRARADLAGGVLCVPAESHVAYYAETDSGIVVVRLLHRRRDPALHFE